MRLRLPAPGIFAAVTVVVLSAALVFSAWWPYHREQTVLESLESLGVVDVVYEYRGPAVFEDYADRKWLRWFLRIRRLHVDLGATGVADVPSLSPLLRCRFLTLGGCTVDHQSMQHVAECPLLWSVKLERCQLEPGALRGLDGHEHLVDIEMVMSRLLDGAVLELPGAPKLVSFRGNYNRNVRVLDVSSTPNLMRVEMKNCPFDDEGVAGLLGATELRVLSMPRTAITDESINYLLEMKSLLFVDLRHDSQLSPEQMERLAGLPRLRTVAVWYAVTDEEFMELLTVLPQATLEPRP